MLVEMVLRIIAQRGEGGNATGCGEGIIAETLMLEHMELVERAIRTVNAYIKYLNSMAPGGDATVSEPEAIYGIGEAGSSNPPTSDRPLSAEV